MPTPRTERGGIDLRKLPYIVFRRLGPNYGLSDHPLWQELTPIKHPMVEIDLETVGRKRLEVAIHESIHIAIPALPEPIVTYTARYVAKVIWALGYRADEDWQEKKFSLANHKRRKKGEE
jgi:hypothetical protein